MGDMDKTRARIRAAMESCDNVSALAERVGVSRQQMYAWREGKAEPTLTNAAALAREMGWTLDYLSGRVDEPDQMYSASDEARRELEAIAAGAQRLAESLRPTPQDEPR